MPRLAPVTRKAGVAAWAATLAFPLASWVYS